MRSLYEKRRLLYFSQAEGYVREENTGAKEVREEERADTESDAAKLEEIWAADERDESVDGCDWGVGLEDGGGYGGCDLIERGAYPGGQVVVAGA